MIRAILYSLWVCLILTGCNSQTKEARARLEKAREMYANDEFVNAKNEIDSLRALYPKEVKVLREGLTLMREVEMKEAERTIVFCDSLLPGRIEEFEKLKKDFTFEKDSLYDTVGKYIWKQQVIERNLERCYIRSGVNEEGEYYVASVYFGTAALNHTGLRLSVPNTDFQVETPSIPYDGGVNYRFEDMGNLTEVVTYSGDNGLEAFRFIADHANERIRAEYTGGKPYVIYIAEGDKKAIAATYNFAMVLGDVLRLHKEKEKSVNRLYYLKTKLESGEDSPVE